MKLREITEEGKNGGQWERYFVQDGGWFPNQGGNLQELKGAAEW